MKYGNLVFGREEFVLLKTLVKCIWIFIRTINIQEFDYKLTEELTSEFIIMRRRCPRM